MRKGYLGSARAYPTKNTTKKKIDTVMRNACQKGTRTPKTTLSKSLIMALPCSP